ncbi:MAG: zinc ribbon domain-containing protein [Nitrospirae bacterium]|nr:MAG: zinc ribbon domain-containing protein [Nitrospirota bacterium]
MVMPMYEYKCLDCGKTFLVARSVKDHESGPPFCPSCQSSHVEHLLSAFMAKTSRKS